MKFVWLFLFILVCAQNGISQTLPSFSPNLTTHAESAKVAAAKNNSTDQSMVEVSQSQKSDSENFWIEEGNLECDDVDPSPYTYSNTIELTTRHSHHFSSHNNDNSIAEFLLEYVSLFSNSPPFLI